MKFKPGDIVRCVKPCGKGLEKDQLYSVVGVWSDGGGIEEVELDTGVAWFAERFELAPEVSVRNNGVEKAYKPMESTHKTLMRRFILRRHADVSGISGTGIVAEGVLFSTGYCAMTWLGPLTSLTFFHSPEVLINIHGHGGKTVMEFLD